MGAPQESIGGLFARLADDASRLVRAEVELYRAVALHRLAQSQRALILLGGALLIVQAAIACLLVMLAIGLSASLGPVGAGLIVTVCALAVAALLARAAVQQFSRVTSEQTGEDKS